MDEPFSGLDPVNRARACELIVELSHLDERNTIIVVTHDIRSAVEVSDTLWLIGRDGARPGSKIVATYDLIERGLAWRPDVARTPPFEALVRELEDRFPLL
jgi:ABC-type nitrate/sulfonate/bicarbonate transport system ATPase subunit